LAEAVQADNLKLFCSPVINLFEKIPDIVDVTPTHHEFLIEPDKFRSTHYEVYDVLDVVGCSADLAKRKLFQPVFGANHGYWSDEGGGYYTFRRELQESLKPQEYLGSLAYISLVDTEHAPYHFHDIKKLDLKILCTNGNLPAKIAPLLGSVPSDFVLKTGAPIKAVRCLAGPSLPRHSFASGESAWRVASHLSLNYLSLLDKVGEAGAVALRELLTLYRSAGDTYALDKISGLSSVYSENVVRRIDTKGPIVFGRGLRIFLEFDKRAYETNGLFLLGAVLAEFFARYASINSFTETVIRSAEREVPWRMRTGQRHIL
jgi:type VI secretion system protein ImpG